VSVVASRAAEFAKVTVVFAEARGVGWLVAARIIQGVATGAATAATSAALIDLQPANRARLGALAASVSPSIGLAAGALGSGLLVQYAPAPTQLIYWLLAALFVVCIAGVALLPATGHPDGRWLPALRPRLTVPAVSRSLFLAMAPCLFAFWALSGLYLSLRPSITSSVLHSRSHLVGGLLITALAGAGALTSVLTGSWPATRALLVGTGGLVVGVVMVLVALEFVSLPLLFVGTLCAGIGFGPAFSGAFKALTATAPADQRSGLVAAIYVVCYLGLSLPAIAAGIAARHVGLTVTATVYGVGIVVLAGIAVAAYLRHERRPLHEVRTPCSCPGTAAVHPSAIP
jgi:MFS family permease